MEAADQSHSPAEICQLGPYRVILGQVVQIGDDQHIPAPGGAQPRDGTLDTARPTALNTA